MTVARIPRPDPAPEGAGILASLIGQHRFHDALEAYFALGDEHRADPSAQCWAATAAARLGRFAPATILAKEAKQGFEAHGSASDRMRVLNLLGALALETGHLAEAEQLFREALTCRGAMEDRILRAHATSNLASIMDLRASTDTALRLYYEALRLYQDAEDTRGIAQTYHNLNIVFRSQSMLEAAESVARLAVKNAGVHGAPALVALCLAGQAETRVAREDFEGARQCLVAARMRSEESADECCMAEVHRVAADFHLKNGEPDQAIAEAEIARSMASRSGATLIAAEASAVSSIGFKTTGRRQEAAERRKEAVQAFQRMEAEWLQQYYARAWDNAGTAGQ